MSFDPLTEKQVAELVERVATMSEESKLTWEETSEYSFRAVMPRFVLLIASEDTDDLHPYRLLIGRTDEPAAIARISSDSDLSVRRPSVVSGLERIYQRAKMTALGLEDFASELVEDLDDLDDG